MLKKISVYSFGNILSAAVSFLLLPLYTRVLTPGDYGVLELMYLAAAILVVIFGLNIELAYSRYYYLCSNESERKKLFTTVQLFKLFCIVVIYLLLNSNREFLVSNYFYFSKGELLLYLIFFSSSIESLIYTPLNLLRIKERPWSYISVNMLNLLTTVFVTCYLLIFRNYGVEGVLYGKLIGALFSFLALFFLTINEWTTRISISRLRSLIGFSIFLIPINFSSLLINLSNRFFLQEYQSLSDVGVFSLGSKIAAVIPILLSEPIKNAFIPHLFSMSSNIEYCKKSLAGFVQFYFVLVSIFVLGLSVYSKEIIQVFASESYLRSQEVVFILSISNLLLGTSALIVLAIHIIKKTWIVTGIWMISAVFNVILNIYFIPRFGNFGAALASLCSVFIILVLYFISTHKYFSLKVDYKSYLKVIFLLTMAFLICNQIKTNFYLEILFKAIVIILYVFVLYTKLNVVDDFYKQRIRSFYFGVLTKFCF